LSFDKRIVVTLMSLSHSMAQIFILSSIRFFCADATNTSVSVVRVLPFDLESILQN
jgi:hypothetical protein